MATKKAVRKEVLSYFVRNPNVTDTLEGVARWRLLEERVHRTLVETGDALEWLSELGLLVKTSSAASGNVFRLDMARTAEAERLLRELEP